MFVVSTILILSIVGSLGAWQPDIDINRVRLLQTKGSNYKRSPHSRRSIFTHKFGNDNDYSRSGLDKPRSQMYPVSNTPPAEPKALKVHQPREDPRLFYQSDTYAKEAIGNSLNNEVSEIYPGRDVVRAGKHFYRRPHSARLKERGTFNDLLYDDVCVTCPHDRTIIVKSGSDRVMLQYPRLLSCHGYKVSREVKFIPMYGPQFGSLLQKGSYGILGQIKYQNKMLKYCYMTVHVLSQTCPLPKYLIADCKDGNKTCSFTCRDSKAELRGSTTLSCGDDARWIGRLPVCSARRWCEPVQLPYHGRVSCKGDTVHGWALADGAICRIKCARGWKPNTKPVSVCRRGVWSQNFTCTLKNID